MNHVRTNRAKKGHLGYLRRTLWYGETVIRPDQTSGSSNLRDITQCTARTKSLHDACASTCLQQGPSPQSSIFQIMMRIALGRYPESCHPHVIIIQESIGPPTQSQIMQVVPYVLSKPTLVQRGILFIQRVYQAIVLCIISSFIATSKSVRIFNCLHDANKEP
mmetsp:Transcript_44821/g.136873  ORF Transcript_44821/g.136873 Transcript_44821/m.136873 type:complete len:163 (+) Transcript_44821:274-762(+)